MNSQYQLSPKGMFGLWFQRLVFPRIHDDLREKARLPKEKNLLKGVCIVWNEDMELERAEIPMFLSSNTRRATEWWRERAGKRGKGCRIAVQVAQGWKRTNVHKYWQGDAWNFCRPIITRFLHHGNKIFKMVKSDGFNFVNKIRVISTRQIVQN